MSYPAPWHGINPWTDELPEQLISPQKKKRHLARLLVVDDEPRARDSLQELLQLSGYEAIVASGGVEAIVKLGESRFELILLDLNMPDMSGQKVMEYINREKIDVDIIIVSGEITFDYATQALRRGAQDFLRKPYAPDELLRAVSNVLEKRRLLEENRSIQMRLEESESLHRFIVNNSPDMIYLLDQDGKFAFVNERIETLLGFKQDEVIGEHFSTLIFQDDLEQANFTFNERRTGDRATTNVELRLRCKDCDLPRHFESRSVSIELSSIGIYTLNQNQSRQFIGTYGVARDITDRKQAEELIRYQLYHDLLTNLPNRSLFRDRLNMAMAQARRSSRRVAVLYLDMDRFKIVNDSLGHFIGDELLQQVAHRLKTGIREADTLARVGGDEFNLLIPEISSEEDARSLAKKILKLFLDPFHIGEEEIFVSFSIGISLYPDHGDSREALIKNADIAMYQVKYTGKNGYAFYAESMKHLYSQSLDIENGLRRAIDNNELRVFYQPQIDIQNNKIVGIEALARWMHPERGLLAPVDFIRVAEDSGLIIQLGEWMLAQACKDISLWLEQYQLKLSLSVNISVQQLEMNDFVPKVLKIIKQHDLPRNVLELEITESEIMQDMERAIKTLSLLSKKGVRIAIDDFGTGYSSLGYLQTLPINTLKMDRSFVNGINSRGDNSIIDAIVAMAKGLNLDLIAEGVETPAQRDYLKRLGCSLAQGFHFSRAVPAMELLELIKENRSSASQTGKVESISRVTQIQSFKS
jgi:diguanylate cyclase (GGDEF)-like protein/PAS domain S-box-containing protein